MMHGKALGAGHQVDGKATGAGQPRVRSHVSNSHRASALIVPKLKTAIFVTNIMPSSSTPVGCRVCLRRKHDFYDGSSGGPYDHLHLMTVVAPPQVHLTYRCLAPVLPWYQFWSCAQDKGTYNKKLSSRHRHSFTPPHAV